MLFQEFLDEDLANIDLIEDLAGQKALRGDWIKNKLGANWRGLPGYEDIDAFIEKLGEVDPSQKGIYMPWLARLAITKPNENRSEDLDRVGDDLRHFEQFKARIANKDINSYKSFQDLFDVIAPFLQPKKLSAEEKAKQKEEARLAKIKSEVDTIYAGPEGWIRIPKTEEAARFLGQNTRWCTAAAGRNMFDHYNNSDKLFVVYDKESKTRSQLHIDSGQFADEADRNKGLDAVPAWARQPIVDWYVANNPQLKLRHLIVLSKFTDQNLAKDSPHEDLLQLFKDYNVKI